MPERTAEPLSPELILVSPPEEAALAREQLADPPETLRREAVADELPADTTDAGWDEFLADVRSRPEPIAAPRPVPRLPAPVQRTSRKRLLIGVLIALVAAAVAGLAWARDSAHDRTGSAPAAPVPPHRQATAPTPPKHAKANPGPAAKAKPKPKAKVKAKAKASAPPKAPAPKRSKPRARHAAGFVPTRVWSWAAAPGASAYVVDFLRNGRSVLKMRTAAPRLRLPSGFTFAPGSYRWTVTTAKGGRVIVNSAFTVTGSHG